MRKRPCRTLREPARLRGPVDEGYGRGGKKLGFPTANLPSSLFADALAGVPTWVYAGWAALEPTSEEKQGRGRVHKVRKPGSCRGAFPPGRGRSPGPVLAVPQAVVNVGYSPTFAGKENKEKIVEAHLIIQDGDIEGDFYGETMRLSLGGYLRPGA